MVGGTGFAPVPMLLPILNYVNLIFAIFNIKKNGGHMWGSNPRHPACKAGVLPAELMAHKIYGGTSQNRTVFFCSSDRREYQLHQSSIMVGRGRLELPISEDGEFTVRCNSHYATYPINAIINNVLYLNYHQSKASLAISAKNLCL